MKSFVLGNIIKVLIITTVALLLASFFCFIVWLGLVKRHIKGLLRKCNCTHKSLRLFRFIYTLHQHYLKGLDKLCLLNLGKLSSQEDEELVWGIGRSPEFKLFDFSEVSNATNNFSDENKLGQGGFGPVYKVKEHIYYSCKQREQNGISLR